MKKVTNINCKWYDSYGKCNRSDKKKYLWIFKRSRSCSLVLTDERCELQEKYPRPKLSPLLQRRTIIDYRAILRKLYTDSGSEISKMERDIKCPHGQINAAPEGDRGTVIWNSYKSQGDKYCRDCKKAL